MSRCFGLGHVPPWSFGVPLGHRGCDAVRSSCPIRRPRARGRRRENCPLMPWRAQGGQAPKQQTGFGSVDRQSGYEGTCHLVSPRQGHSSGMFLPVAGPHGGLRCCFVIGQRHFRRPYKHEAQASEQLTSKLTHSLTHSLAHRACRNGKTSESGPVQVGSPPVSRLRLRFE
jgi:hypothetical protein